MLGLSRFAYNLTVKYYAKMIRLFTFLRFELFCIDRNNKDCICFQYLQTQSPVRATFHVLIQNTALRCPIQSFLTLGQPIRL